MPAKGAAKPLSLDAVFDELKAMLVSHATRFTVRTGMVKNKRDYHLISKKPVELDDGKKKERYFASVIQQKHSVGFYFNPAYGCDEVKPLLSADLLKHLDGKTCFHFAALTPQLKKDVQAALKIGLKAYREREWI